MTRLPTKADKALGSWMSAALDCPNTCDEMKAAVREWFDSFDWSEIPENDEELKCVITITGQKDSSEMSMVLDFDPVIKLDEDKWSNSGAQVGVQAVLNAIEKLQVDYCNECDTTNGHMSHCSREQYQR